MEAKKKIKKANEIDRRGRQLLFFLLLIISILIVFYIIQYLVQSIAIGMGNDFY